jgi:hypothetical protein
MKEHQASRTLLKSPPELWAECSDAQSLARHLDSFFGEIRITRIEPESTVAWEGERASGTVRLEPSGWGTKVTVTATTDEPQPVAAPEPQGGMPEPAEIASREEPRPTESIAAQTGFLARMRRLFALPSAPDPGHATTESSHERPPEALEQSSQRRPPAVTEPPAPAAQPTDPRPEEPDNAVVALSAALDSLGQAHHRPFSRA